MNQEIGTGNTELSKDERTMGMLCHLLALCGFVIPFGNIIGPVVLWAVKKDESSFVDDQGKESLNFQITLTIACVICFILMFVAIGFLLLIVLGIYALVMIIIAAMKANEGVRYRYPFAIRLIK